MSSLLHLSLGKSSISVLSTFGDFTGSGLGSCELLIVRPGSLELYGVDDTGKLHCLNVTTIFAVIRSASIIRPASMGCDCVLLGSDSGYISISNYDTSIKGWKIVTSAGYGRTGCLKDTPGQYVAGDKHGMRIMVASVESQFAIYEVCSHTDVETASTSASGEEMEIITSDQKPTISHDLKTLSIASSSEHQQSESPAVAPCVMFALRALDLGPTAETTFVAIEASRGTTNEVMKCLTIYHVNKNNGLVRHDSIGLHREANILIPLPLAARQSGFNGGFLVCGVGIVSLHILDTKVVVNTRIPNENDLIICGTAHLLTSGSTADGQHLLVLVQGESGTLYRVALAVTSESPSVNVSIFEGASKLNIYSNAAADCKANTIPVSTSLAISKSGLLFCAGEGGTQNLYAISSLDASVESGVVLQNLRLVDTLNSHNSGMSSSMSNGYHGVSPIMDMFCEDLLDISIPQIYTLSGNGSEGSASANTSHLRISKKGCAVQSLGTTTLINRKLVNVGESQMPTGMWTITNSNLDSPQYDRFVVVSFVNSTALLAIDAETGTVASYQSSSGDNDADTCAVKFRAINTQVRTLHCCLLADDCLLQVHPDGLTHISANGQEVSHWEIPPEYIHNRTIEHVSCNGSQLAISLCASEVDAMGAIQVVRGNGGGSYIIYFELDLTISQLVDCGTISGEGKDVACLDVGEVTLADGKITLSKNIAVAFWDDSVQLISLDNTKPVEYLKKQASVTFMNRPNSVCFFSTSTTLYLNVGCVNGELVRLKVAANIAPGGSILSVASQQLLAEQLTPVSLTRIKIKDASGKSAQAIVAAAALTMLVYGADTGRVVDAIIPIKPVDCCCSMASKNDPESYVNLLTMTEGKSFEILSLSNIDCSTADSSSVLASTNSFSHKHVPLNCTPRKMSPITLQWRGKNKSLVVVAQAECNASKWESYLSLVDPSLSGEEAISDTFNFDGNVAAFSVCVVNHISAPGAKIGKEKFPIIIVGTGTNMDVTTGVGTAYALHKFTTRFNKETGKYMFNLLHSAQLDAFPRTMCSFDPIDEDLDARQAGRYAYLLVGAGYKLHAFEVNKKGDLVKRCEYSLGTKSSVSNDGDKWGPNPRNNQIISRIAVFGSRIFVGDSTNSVSFVRYNRTENCFVGYADDRECPRFVSALVALDKESVGCGDRFGNICTLQLPDGLDNDADASRSYEIDDGFGHTCKSGTETEDKVDAKTDGKKRTAKDSTKDKISAPRLKYQRTGNSESILKSHFFVGESVTTMCTTRSQFFTGHQINFANNSNVDIGITVGARGYFNNSGSIILAATIGGGLSAFVPMRDESAYFYINLESCIRRSNYARCEASAIDVELKQDYSDNSTISGGLCVRHHQSYRSYFHPSKGTIDGDLLLTYKTMVESQQVDIAGSLSKIIAIGNETDANAGSTPKITPQQIIDRLDNTTSNTI